MSIKQERIMNKIDELVQENKLLREITWTKQGTSSKDLLDKINSIMKQDASHTPKVGIVYFVRLENGGYEIKYAKTNYDSENK